MAQQTTLQIRQEAAGKKHRIRLTLERLGLAKIDGEASIAFALTPREQEELRWYMEDYLQVAAAVDVNVSALKTFARNFPEAEMIEGSVQSFSGHRAPPAHFDEPHGISVREAARLQGFPDTFRVYGPFADRVEQMTNFVPPPPARVARCRWHKGALQRRIERRRHPGVRYGRCDTKIETLTGPGRESIERYPWVHAPQP